MIWAACQSANEDNALFCEYCGQPKDSTELIKDLDPEAARQLFDLAINRMLAAMHRFDGTVNQVLGDGIVAFFGAPVAHAESFSPGCYDRPTSVEVNGKSCHALLLHWHEEIPLCMSKLFQ